MWIPQLSMALCGVGFALACAQALWSALSGRTFVAEPGADAPRAD